MAVLVNTRGLTELIALNAALDAGLIGERVFSVLVVMALLMTIVTGPLLRLIGTSGGRRPTGEDSTGKAFLQTPANPDALG